MPTYIMSSWERLLFTAIPILAILGFFAVVGAVIFRSYHKSKRTQQDKRPSVKNEAVQLIAKRREHSAHETQYFADFLRADGSSSALLIDAQAYTQLFEGDSGILCTQGACFLSFRPHENSLHENS